MRNLNFTKVLFSLLLMFGLTTSSFAAGPGVKSHGDKAKVEQKVNKKDLKHEKHGEKSVQKHHNKDFKVAKKHNHEKDVKIVKVYNDGHHKHHHKHHGHHDKVVYYSYCNDGADFALKCIGTGLCLAMVAAAVND